MGGATAGIGEYGPQGDKGHHHQIEGIARLPKQPGNTGVDHPLLSADQIGRTQRRWHLFWLRWLLTTVTINLLCQYRIDGNGEEVDRDAIAV